MHRLFVTGLLAGCFALFGYVPAADTHDTPAPGTHFSPPGHDLPGPPPIITRVTLNGILHPDMDDGGGDAEVTVTIFVEHTGHGGSSSAVTEPDLNYDDTQGNWAITQEVYSHRECTPMEPLTITVAGLEADATNLDQLEQTILTAVTELIGMIDFRIDSSLLARIITGTLAAINPDDTLGSGAVVAPGPGPYQVTTTGGDYSITAFFDVTTEPVAGTECDPDSTPPPPQEPPFCYQSTKLFDKLSIAWIDVDLVNIEAGNPAGVTPLDVADSREAIRTALRGTAQWCAAHMLEDARGLVGFGPAWSQYAAAIPLLDASSIPSFRDAWCAAELAKLNAIPDPLAPPMPLLGVAVPRLHATRSGRAVEYLVGAFGDNSHAQTVDAVFGGPPGASFSVSPADPAHPSWHILRVEQNGPAGRYPVMVSFTGLEVPDLLVEVDVMAGGPTAAPAPAAATSPFVLQVAARAAGATSDFARLDVPAAARISIALFDVAGRRILDVAEQEPRPAGRHEFAIDSRSLATGVYYVRARAESEAGTREATGKLIVLR